MSGIRALRKVVLGLPCPHPLCEAPQEVGSLHSGGGLSPDPKRADSLILDFSFQSWQKQVCVVYKVPYL